jgi:hypothetical protein
MVGKRYVVQEALVQHPAIARVSPTAINCLRVHTYRDETGRTSILSTLMRFATGGRVIDHPSSGAIFLPVDEATGRLVGPGRTHYKLGGAEYDVHPDTGVPFDGYQLPDWETVLQLMERAAPAFDKPFIGWDVAFTVDGPVVIEGNSSPHLLLAQIAVGGFRRHPGFWPLFAPYVRHA